MGRGTQTPSYKGNNEHRWLSPPCPRIKASWEVASGRADVAACPHTEVTDTRTPLFASPPCCRALRNTVQGASSASPEARAKEKGAYCCSMSPFNPSQQFPWLLLDYALHQANARPRNGAKRLQLPSFCAAEEEKENDFSSALHIPFSSTSYMS